ncbi:MAG: hypothetical protein KY469_15480 [Actinobacteria bacterium]|nr:hypothetical protein [Actinomycetota bacterium]
MNVPAAVLAVVLAEAAVGGLAILWASPTWRAVRHGYEILLGSTLALMALGAWASLRTPLDSVIESATTDTPVQAATWTGRGLAAVAILAGLSAVLLLTRQAMAGRIVGIVSAVVGVVTLVPLALLRTATDSPGGFPQGLIELLLGAFFLGAVWDGLILGHWYLVERRLSKSYMEWMARVNIAAVIAGALAVLLSARNPVPCAGLTGRDLELCALTFSPLLSIGSTTLLLGFGVVALVAIIAGFNYKLAQEGGRSIQAATGMFYLAVILAPAAEFAAKVRFF